MRGVIPINSLMASNFAAWRFSIASSSAEHSQVDGTLPLPLLLPLQMLRSLTRRSMRTIDGCSAVCARASAGGAAVQSAEYDERPRVFEALVFALGLACGQLGTSMWPGVVVVPARG